MRYSYKAQRLLSISKLIYANSMKINYEENISVNIYRMMNCLDCDIKGWN